MNKLIGKLKDFWNKPKIFVDHFEAPEYLMRLSGTNVFDATWYWNGTLRAKLSFVLFVTFSSCTTVFSSLSVIHPFDDDLEDRLTATMAALCGFEVLGKSLTFILFRENFRQLKDLAIEHSREGLRGKDHFYRPIITKYEKYGRFVVIMVFVNYYMACAVLILYPLLFGKEWMYPVNIIIPGLYPKAYPGYAINYVNISIMTFCTASTFAAFDTYLVLLCLYMSSRFELCSEYFDKIGSSKYYSSAEYIHYCSLLHAKTVELYESMQETVEYVIGLQVYCMATIMAANGILTLINPWNSYYLMMISTILEAFLYCLSAEVIAFKAAEVADKIYNAKWYEIDDIRTKKMLVLVMARSQQPFYLNFKGRALSLEAFTNIMSFGFKVFNTAQKKFTVDILHHHHHQHRRGVYKRHRRNISLTYANLQG
ncbi:odorant receptor 22c-like [Culicoides brevitarsis]|uniref:odorant receptor 22c-like n=1 Tax=Culicoides brevitarsis TaxID=469753 RepID=UPI00307B71F4